MKQLLPFFTLGIMLFLAIACQRDDNDASSLPEEQQVNQFIEKSMKSVYFWADQIKDIRPDLNQEPKNFLKSLCYPEDQWSYLEKEETTTRSLTNGKEKTFGYKIQFYKIAEDMICGMVLFVYKGSPADKVGIKRGDIIVSNNGKFLTQQTYMDVLNAETLTVKVGHIQNNALIVSDQEFHLSKTIVEQNPILLDTVLHVYQKKIGYLVYANFFDNGSTHLSQLSQTIRKMKDANVDEFILDLRYNVGGAETAAQRLSSLIAPAFHVRNQAILIQKRWNSTYQKKLTNNQLVTRFDTKVLEDNLDLQKMYILTGKRTASASEVIISGLQPYLQITTIGSKTTGKYVGMQKVAPTKTELKKWTLWPVTFSYTNAVGNSVKGGISPNYLIEEYETHLPPFGSVSDPLLNKALTLIQGVSSFSIGKSNADIDQSSFRWQAIGEVETLPLLGL